MEINIHNNYIVNNFKLFKKLCSKEINNLEIKNEELIINNGWEIPLKEYD